MWEVVWDIKSAHFSSTIEMKKKGFSQAVFKYFDCFARSVFSEANMILCYKVSLLAGLLAFGVKTVTAYSDPEPCSGSCWAHDPALIQRASDGLYYRFNTDTYIDIKTSTSLSGPWTDAGSVLPSGSIATLSGSTGLWVSYSLMLPLLARHPG